MEYQDSAQPEYFPTRCAGCRSPLPNELNRFFCAKCQDRVPVSGHVPMKFETVEAGDSEGGIRVSVGNATKILFWEDFEEPAQLWNRVGDLVHLALVWGPSSGTWNQMEAESDAAIDTEQSAEPVSGGDDADLSDLPDF